MNIPSSIYTMLAGIALTLISIWLGQNHGLLPIAASEESHLIDGLFNAMMTISVGLFLIVQGVIIYAAIRFRRRQGDETDGAAFEGNIPLEILWTAIPAVIVLGISVYSFDIYNQIGGLNPMGHSVAHAQSSKQGTHFSGAAIAATLADATAGETVTTSAPPIGQAVEAEPGANQVSPVQSTSTPNQTSTETQKTASEFVVNVTGLQYAWIFTYPDSNVTTGELHLPIGRTIKLNISANDVIHAFWVPEFRLKQDAIPGQTTELQFTPDRIGQYPVICAELCGAYHGIMKTIAIVETPQEFEAWIASQQIASQPEGLQGAIAAATRSNSPAEFLAPFTQAMGIDADTLEQIPASLNHHHLHADL
ncbi:cytochrome C oxidase subunit II [Leptolyngbya sp. 'hensonii']|uniref:cytochrome c oxidase subunit II n=1 Tax=Leptolyngbya sp. 'hensonii' TaxID=1922337 RepID=UPI00094FA434|nr:cytochrome c oxidase subunit II [Leptolyngbya sp. 'hensonii']OLP15594.1 cytochrome C oxidase subunit II [Leptolyngbya sp. 'hensonii']